MYKKGAKLILKDDGISYEEQRLPDSVKYVNETGCLVVDEKVIDTGRITRVISYIPPNPYEPRHWTQKEMEKECIRHIYYISNVDGGYLGSEQDYKLLVEKRNLILIQKANPAHKTCSIGYSPKENKWYGWSHRAIYGFTVGDVVKEGDLTASSGFVEEYRIQHPDEDMALPVGYRARDLNGAKRMAIAFASAVG